jgi:prepilin-type N-terminal cleavage/methylation domain-containing protein
MLISKAERGFTLIEVVVSLGIFALIFSGALAVKLSEERLANWNSTTRDNLTYLEAVRGIMVDSMTYSDILDLKNTGRVYICVEDLGIYNFTAARPERVSYISMRIIEGPVIEVEMELHQYAFGKEEFFDSKFFKGKYKR